MPSWMLQASLEMAEYRMSPPKKLAQAGPHATEEKKLQTRMRDLRRMIEVETELSKGTTTKSKAFELVAEKKGTLASPGTIKDTYYALRQVLESEDRFMYLPAYVRLRAKGELE